MKFTTLVPTLLLAASMAAGCFIATQASAEDGAGPSHAEAAGLDAIVAPGTKPEVIGTGYGFSEGPIADAAGNVYFSDGKHDSIYYYEVGKPVVRFVDDSIDANGEKINTKGELYTCEGAAYRVVAFDVKTKKKRTLCKEIDGTHFNEPNDLTIDHLDGFYFTDPNYSHHGQKAVMPEAIYYCSPGGRVSRVSTACSNPNGILLAPDEKTIYLGDCRGQRIYRSDVLAPGKLGPARRWIDVHANPDGMTLDGQNNLYLGCGGAGVRVYSPKGQLLGTIKVSYASNLCFGGPDFKTLYITAKDKFLAVKTQVVGLKPLPLRVKETGGTH